MKRFAVTGILLIASALVACGDDDGSDGSASDDLGAKQVKDLSAEEEKSICEEESAKFKPTKEDLCEFAGIFGASLDPQKTCEQIKTECLSQPDQSPSSDCTQRNPNLSTCSATVDEVLACSKDRNDQLVALTCASDPGDLTAVPDSCAAVQQKCPGFFSDSSGS